MRFCARGTQPRPLPAVDYRFGDFLDLETIAAAVAGVDAVFHVASTTFPTTADRDLRADARENLLGTMGIVETMLGPCVNRLFLSSGGRVYGMPTPQRTSSEPGFSPSPAAIPTATIWTGCAMILASCSPADANHAAACKGDGAPGQSAMPKEWRGVGYECV